MIKMHIIQFSVQYVINFPSPASKMDPTGPGNPRSHGLLFIYKTHYFVFCKKNATNIAITYYSCNYFSKQFQKLKI